MTTISKILRWIKFQIIYYSCRQSNCKYILFWLCMFMSVFVCLDEYATECIPYSILSDTDSTSYEEFFFKNQSFELFLSLFPIAYIVLTIHEIKVAYCFGFHCSTLLRHGYRSMPSSVYLSTCNPLVTSPYRYTCIWFLLYGHIGNEMHCSIQLCHARNPFRDKQHLPRCPPIQSRRRSPSDQTAWSICFLMS